MILHLARLTLDQTILDVVYETKLLGVTITSDCKWSKHIANITEKANSKIWFLRRLKSLGASTSTLIDVYKLFVRQGLEMSVPLWAPSITAHDSDQIERTQRKITAILCEGRGQTLDYTEQMAALSLVSLSERRTAIIWKFAISMSRDEKYSNIFPKRKNIRTRNPNIYVEPQCLTRRYFSSSIPTFIRIANKEASAPSQAKV